jgi:hypothetical protein
MYIRKEINSYIVSIRPVGDSYPNAELEFGEFELNKSKFFCFGEYPAFLFDSIPNSFVYYSTDIDTVGNSNKIELHLDILTDLNTIEVLKIIKIQGVDFFIYIQPCINFSKLTRKRNKLLR